MICSLRTIGFPMASEPRRGVATSWPPLPHIQTSCFRSSIKNNRDVPSSSHAKKPTSRLQAVQVPAKSFSRLHHQFLAPRTLARAPDTHLRRHNQRCDIRGTYTLSHFPCLHALRKASSKTLPPRAVPSADPLPD